jgi:hypothetical protein
MCSFVSACSVGMAMSGKENPNIDVLTIGQSRSVVALHLGQPAQTLIEESGRVDVYQLERGNAPSVGRATGHAVMDLLTLGAWEIIGTPIEGFAGEKFTITVYYDENDKVSDVQGTAPKGTLD